MKDDKTRAMRRLSNALNANDMVSAKKIIESDVKRYLPKCEYYFYLGLVSEDFQEKLQYYNKAIEYGMKPEDARGILPLDTATKVIYTYSIREWQHVLDLRLYDKTGIAHPNVHVVMQMVKDQINNFAKEHNIDYQV